MGYLFSSALRDFARPRRVAAWLVGMIVIGLMAGVGAHYIGDLTTPQKYAVFSSLFGHRLVGLLAAVFSTAVLSQEVEQKTVVYLLTRPIQRPQLLIARTLAAATVVFALSAICVSMIAFTTSAGFGAQFVRDLLAMLVGSLTYTSVFVLVSLLVNRAMTVCLLYCFGWELLSANMPGNLFYTSIYSYMGSIAKHVQLEAEDKGFAIIAGQLGNTVSTSMALIICGAIVIFAMSVAAWWFRENEFLPREDAE